jgi:glycosyltransferase involved in cell wall biosynthesis
MQTDQISVVVPCWNYGRFLRECVDSLLAQTVLPKEIIITDDASTDDSRAIIIEYIASYPELIGCIFNPERLGTIKNENQATSMVTAPWMFFLDADDRVEPTYIEKVLQVIESRDDKLMVVYSDMQKFGKWEGVWTVSEWDPVALRNGNYINGHSVFRMDLFNNIGMLKDNGHFEDQFMWCEMMDLDPAFYGVRIPEPLVWYRRHDYGHRTDGDDITKRS